MCLDPPEPPGVFLGCNHIVGEMTIKPGVVVRTMEYDMADFMKMATERFQTLASKILQEPVDLVPARTPGLPEDHKNSPQRAPWAHGPSIRCVWCCQDNCITRKSADAAVDWWNRFDLAIDSVTHSGRTSAGG